MMAAQQNPTVRADASISQADTPAGRESCRKLLGPLPVFEFPLDEPGDEAAVKVLDQLRLQAFALGPFAPNGQHGGLAVGSGHVGFARLEAGGGRYVMRPAADQAHDFLVEAVDFAANFFEGSALFGRDHDPDNIMEFDTGDQRNFHSGSDRARTFVLDAGTRMRVGDPLYRLWTGISGTPRSRGCLRAESRRHQRSAGAVRRLAGRPGGRIRGGRAVIGAVSPVDRGAVSVAAGL